MRPISAAAVLGLLCFTASGSSTHASLCPATGGTYTWEQGEVPKSVTDHWFMSPCARATPVGHNTSVYLALAANHDFVRIEFDVIASPWYRETSDSYVSNFTTTQFGPASGVWAQVTVTCNSSVAAGTVMANGPCRNAVDAESGNYWFIPILMNCGTPGNTPVPPTTTSPPTPTPSPTAAPFTVAPADCGQFSSCTSCTGSNSGTCGFCQSSNTCQVGTSSGPNSGSCAQWEWVTSQCPTAQPPPPADCGQFQTCATCTNANSGTCGFCHGTKQCLDGTPSGPNNSSSCPAGHWEWLSSECSQ